MISSYMSPLVMVVSLCCTGPQATLVARSKFSAAGGLSGISSQSSFPVFISSYSDSSSFDFTGPEAVLVAKLYGLSLLSMKLYVRMLTIQYPLSL